MKDKVNNQLRKCKSCKTVWQTHEKGGKLFRCPHCGTTTKFHEILKGDRIFLSHQMNPDDYTNLLLNCTWHETFRRLRGFYLTEKYCANCKELKDHPEYCKADICIYFNK